MVRDLPNWMNDDATKQLTTQKKQRYYDSAFGDGVFAAAGPGLWNSFPPHLRDADLPYSRLILAVTKHFCLDSGATAQCELF